MKAYIYWWGDRRLHGEVFYSLEEAVASANYIYNTFIRADDLVLLNNQDTSIRTLSTTINNYNYVRFYRCEIDTSKLLLRKGSGPEAA